MMRNAPFDPRPESEEAPVEEPSGNPSAASETSTAVSATLQQRGASDPLLGFVIATGFSIGLIPILPQSVELRYTLAWSALACVGVLSWLLGSMDRIDQERPDNLGWGILYGLLVGIPFLVFLGQPVLGPTGRQLFPDMSAGSLLAYMIFVMPLAETLFFRGLLQGRLVFWLVGLLAALWNIVLFFPVMWGAVTEFPAVTLVLVILLLLLNLLYVYVRQRNGLASAWLCQIVANLIIFYAPMA